MASLIGLSTGERVETWRALGFRADGDQIALGLGGSGPMTLTCAGDGGGPHRWALCEDGAEDHHSVADVDGIAITWVAAAEPPGLSAAAHPNTVVGLDHVVVRSPDLDRTTAALTALGADRRRIRSVTVGGEAIQQRFFRFGGPIVELVGPERAPIDADTMPATIWGYAFAVADIDAAATLVGDACSAPKDAVQPGRRIATVRTRDLGIAPTVAFMTPHRG